MAFQGLGWSGEVNCACIDWCFLDERDVHRVLCLSRFSLFNSWMIQMIHPLEKKRQHLRGTCRLGSLFQQFSLSLFGVSHLKGLPTDVIIPKTNWLSREAGVFYIPFWSSLSPKLVTQLFGGQRFSHRRFWQLWWFWQVDSFFGNGRISDRWSVIHHRNVPWSCTYVRLPLVVTVSCYIIISWNDLIQKQAVEKEGKIKNIIKRPFQMLVSWM